MANTQFLTSTIESCVCLLSRPVPLLNASHFPLGGQYIITELSIFLLSLILPDDRDHGISGA